MVAHRLAPQTLEERLIYWSIISAWGLYLLGALFVAWPLAGWVLAGLAITRRLGWRDEPEQTVARSSPVVVSAWLMGMALMLVALIVGHIDFDLPTTQIIKSSLGWVKGWALLAIFVFAGAMTRLRAPIVYRAMNILGLQTLLITPLLILCVFAGAPPSLYVSPLHYVIGSDKVFYEVVLYMRDASSLGFRLMYFTPWAPAAAFFGTIAFVCALYDRDPRWRTIGVVAAVSMCFFSLSRLSLVAIPVLVLALLAVANIVRPTVVAASAIAVAMILVIGDPILELFREAQIAFTGARSDSSRVRAAIQQIGLHRWWEEAPIFGHGIVERGPHLVEFMAIGSHHTWIGLLFTKGIVGFLACALPLGWTLIEFAAKGVRDRVARGAFGCMLVVFLFSFGENLDVLAYLIWPAFLLAGIAARRRLSMGPVPLRIRRMSYVTDEAALAR